MKEAIWCMLALALPTTLATQVAAHPKSAK